MELQNARRHSLCSCPARSLIESTAAERYPLAGRPSLDASSMSISELRARKIERAIELVFLIIFSLLFVYAMAAWLQLVPSEGGHPLGL